MFLVNLRIMFILLFLDELFYLTVLPDLWGCSSLYLLILCLIVLLIIERRILTSPTLIELSISPFNMYLVNVILYWWIGPFLILICSSLKCLFSYCIISGFIVNNHHFPIQLLIFQILSPLNQCNVRLAIRRKSICNIY